MATDGRELVGEDLLGGIHAHSTKHRLLGSDLLGALRSSSAMRVTQSPNGMLQRFGLGGPGHIAPTQPQDNPEAFSPGPSRARRGVVCRLLSHGASGSYRDGARGWEVVMLPPTTLLFGTMMSLSSGDRS